MSMCISSRILEAQSVDEEKGVLECLPKMHLTHTSSGFRI